MLPYCIAGRFRECKLRKPNCSYNYKYDYRPGAVGRAAGGSGRAVWYREPAPGACGQYRNNTLNTDPDESVHRGTART